jgi:hypothetical protein
MKEQAPQTTTAVTEAINHFQSARQAQQTDVTKMEEITGDILRCQQQKQEAETQSEQTGNQWRETFRKLRGQVGPEIKQQHLQRLAEQEMARELGELLLSLDIEKDRQEIACSASGETLLKSHGNALMAYASQELTQALSAGLAPLIRAMVMKQRALAIEQSFITLNGRLSDYEINPVDTLCQEVISHLKTAMSGYAFDMQKEPVLSQIGLSRPEVKFLNPKMTTVGGRTMANAMIKRKQEQLGIAGTSS